MHPDDALAEERHNSYGKTEAWYVVDCKPGAAIYLGFKDLNITREEYIAAVSESRLEPLLNKVEVHPGDVFFIPAGTALFLISWMRICPKHSSPSVPLKQLK